MYLYVYVNTYIYIHLGQPWLDTSFASNSESGSSNEPNIRLAVI